MFAPGGDAGQVYAALASAYDVRALPATRSRWVCLDTADWRLHRAGFVLRDTRVGSRGQLVLSANGAQPLTAPNRAAGWPRRLEALPGSALRDRLAPVVGVRALLPRAEVDVHTVAMELRDELGKIRVRIRVEQHNLVTAAQPAHERRCAMPLSVTVSALRGYERDAHRCVELLAASLTRVNPDRSLADVAMTAAGHPPGEAAVAVPVLDGGAPALVSLALMLRRWAEVMAAEQPGIIDDVDPEYLHEFRTAVRATRSVVRLSADLLAGTNVAGFADEFAWLGRLTGPLRDLDVHLLELAGDGSIAGGLPDLDPLRQYLARRRRAALREVRGGLHSARRRALGDGWLRTLDLLAEHTSGPTTVEAGHAGTLRAYRRVRSAARAVRAAPATVAVEDVHRLRRRCKHMRYLMQDYQSVFVPAPYRVVLKQLKVLQEQLGEIQDAEVQRAQLEVAATEIGARGGSVHTVLSIGALRDRIAGSDLAARESVAGAIERFLAPRVGDEVRALVRDAS
jgi:CHAD domain-containing protein